MAARERPRLPRRSSPLPTPFEHGFGAEVCAAILTDSVAAVSAGIVAGEPVLDLDYREDSTADVDINVVRLGKGGLVEVQGTGEGGTFSRGQLDLLLNLAEQGINQLTNLQREALGPNWPLAVASATRG